jgi:hypothetical protein
MASLLSLPLLACLAGYFSSGRISIHQQGDQRLSELETSISQKTQMYMSAIYP